MSEDIFNIGKIFNFTNFSDHPTNSRYKVFFFKGKEEADHFELLLEKNSIVFERDTETEDGEKIFFAVRNDYYKQALKINFITTGKFRKPLISNVYLRWLLVLGGLFIIAIGVISYIKS